MPIDSAELRRKALHAAVAVTMGAAIVACGSEDTTSEQDAAVSEDASADAVDDVSIDVFAACSGTADGVCGDTCARDNDADCCEVDSLCFWSVESSTCGCAVEGPFAPPSLPLRSRGLRHTTVA